MLVLATMFLWWRDIIREAEYQGHHTPIVQIGMRYGMMLFIASEVMFFVAFFWAFFDRAFIRMKGSGARGITTFDPFDLPLINTLVLLLSGCTVTWAHHALQHDNRKDFLMGLGLTIVLGALFTALQALEPASHAPFGFTEGICPSVFYGDWLSRLPCPCRDFISGSLLAAWPGWSLHC